MLCTFNKLKGLTTDEDLIIQAAKESEQLKVDETSKSIKRASPIPSLSNLHVDACTVFAVC